MSKSEPKVTVHVFGDDPSLNCLDGINIGKTCHSIEEVVFPLYEKGKIGDLSEKCGMLVNHIAVIQSPCNVLMDAVLDIIPGEQIVVSSSCDDEQERIRRRYNRNDIQIVYPEKIPDAVRDMLM